MVVPGRKLDVELVEGDGDAPEALGALGVPDEPSARPASTWRRVRRAWPIAVVALLLAAGYAISGAWERAAHERLQEALHGQPGFLEDLSAPLRPMWSTADLSGSYFPVGSVGDTVLGGAVSGASQSVVALDAATGEQRWSVASEGDAMSEACAWPVIDTYASGPAVACVASSPRAVAASWNYVVEHRDVATGEVLASSGERSARGLAAWGAGFAELVSVERGTELRLTDLEGRVEWASRLLDRHLGPTEFTQVAVHEDVVTVVIGRRVFVVDTTGRVVVDHRFDTAGSVAQIHMDDFVGDYYGFVEVLPGGGFSVVDAGSDRRTWLYDADGTPVREWEGARSQVGLDDGSLGATALGRESGDLVLIDLETQEERFRIEDLRDAAVLLLDGDLVLSEPTTLRSVDVATGEERWSMATSDQILGSDGAAVLVSDRDSPVTRLRAIDLDSGRELWTTTVDLTDALLIPFGGALYLYADDGLVRFGR